MSSKAQPQRSGAGPAPESTPPVSPVSLVSPADPIVPLATDDVRQLAYRKWEEAGRPDGDGAEFWLEAERELKDAFPD